MGVHFTVDGPFVLPGRPALKRLAEKVVKAENLIPPIDIVFCGDEWVRELNKTHRRLDKVTDVLSFHYGESDLLGEIYIALPQTRRQAPRWKNSYEKELRRVMVHGLLHLAGYDHATASERKSMRLREDFFLDPPKKAKKRDSG